MENYYLCINLDSNNYVTLFHVFDLRKKLLYKGSNKIKDRIENDDFLTLKYLKYYYSVVINLNNVSFKTSINLNFSDVNNKKLDDVLKEIQLSEWLI